MISRFYIAVTMFASVGTAQAPTAPAVPTQHPATIASRKSSAFDVVSIKPARPGEGWHYGFGPPATPPQE
jgi:hypothetical protein